MKLDFNLNNINKKGIHRLVIDLAPNEDKGFRADFLKEHAKKLMTDLASVTEDLPIKIGCFVQKNEDGSYKSSSITGYPDVLFGDEIENYINAGGEATWLEGAFGFPVYDKTNPNPLIKHLVCYLWVLDGIENYYQNNQSLGNFDDAYSMDDGNWSDDDNTSFVSKDTVFKDTSGASKLAIGGALAIVGAVTAIISSKIAGLFLIFGGIALGFHALLTNINIDVVLRLGYKAVKKVGNDLRDGLVEGIVSTGGSILSSLPLVLAGGLLLFLVMQKS